MTTIIFFIIIKKEIALVLITKKLFSKENIFSFKESYYAISLNSWCMKFFEYSEKLEIIKYFAAHKRTGSPEKLAEKINVSRRTTLRMIQQLKNHGCPIVFNRFRNTYEIRDQKELP